MVGIWTHEHSMVGTDKYNKLSRLNCPYLVSNWHRIRRDIRQVIFFYLSFFLSFFCIIQKREQDDEWCKNQSKGYIFHRRLHLWAFVWNIWGGLVLWNVFALLKVAFTLVHFTHFASSFYNILNIIYLHKLQQLTA